MKLNQFMGDLLLCSLAMLPIYAAILGLVTVYVGVAYTFCLTLAFVFDLKA